LLARVTNACDVTNNLATALDPNGLNDHWLELRPDDPNILEAKADLLLEHGHGRSDASRALDLLRKAVERYPYHERIRRTCNAPA
jgi:hypothetical protein